MLYYLLLIGGLIAFVCRVLFTAFKPSLRDIPGPWLAKFTDLWRTYYAWRGDNIETLRWLQKKYGNVVRIGPNCILVSEGGQFETILGFKRDFIKSDSMKPWKVVNQGKTIDGIASTQDKKRHAELKKPIANIYSMTNTVSYEPSVDETIRYFLKRLDEAFISRPNNGRPCDIDNWLQYYAFDVVGEFTLSRRLGFLEQGTDIDGMLGDLHSEFSYRGFVQNMPWLDDWLAKNPLYLWFKSPTSKFITRARDLIQSRLAEEKTTPRHDFMDRFLQAQKQHPDVVTPQVLAGYVSTNFLAGSDTTAVAMRAILYYVHRTPGVLYQLRKELDASGTEYPVPYKTAQKLPYLDAVIREAMRIHFIASILLERVVPKEGYQLPSGKNFEPGTILALSPWTLNFNESIFGQDPEVFKPERWLQQSGESEETFQQRLATMKQNDFSFSYGPRVCLGRHIATLEIYKTMPTILGLLDMTFVKPDKEWRVEGSFFTRQYDMDMYLNWRKDVNKELYVA